MICENTNHPTGRFEPQLHCVLLYYMSRTAKKKGVFKALENEEDSSSISRKMLQ